jgi:ABC-2 type transport system permease protein/oleandomycin transport system permease protein
MTAGLLRRAGRSVKDTLLMTRRNLLHYVRVPQLIVYTVIQPIMFTLLFGLVFRGSINTGVDYVDYLLPGIIIQTVVFGAMGTGIKIAEDVQKGIMDRFRSLPIARGTVLAARTLTDTFWNTLAIFIMAGVGFLMGYRYHGDPLNVLPALGLSVLIAFSFSWIALTIGVFVRETQAVEAFGFTWVFPLVFISSIFVEPKTMPSWLRGFAHENPISHAADAVRNYSLGRPVGDDAWITLLWCAAILSTFSPLAVWRFRRLG